MLLVNLCSDVLIKFYSVSPVSSFFCRKPESGLEVIKRILPLCFSVHAELTELHSSSRCSGSGLCLRSSSRLRKDQLLIIELQPAKNSLLLNHNKHMNDLSENTRRLLRNLAHEIKNPLGGIRGATQLFRVRSRG